MNFKPKSPRNSAPPVVIGTMRLHSQCGSPAKCCSLTLALNRGHPEGAPTVVIAMLRLHSRCGTPARHSAVVSCLFISVGCGGAASVSASHPPGLPGLPGLPGSASSSCCTPVHRVRELVNGLRPDLIRANAMLETPDAVGKVHDDKHDDRFLGKGNKRMVMGGKHIAFGTAVHGKGQTFTQPCANTYEALGMDSTALNRDRHQHC